MGIRIWAVVAFSGALGLTGCGSDEPASQGGTSYKGTIAAVAESNITINSGGEPLTFEMNGTQIESDSDGELAQGKLVTIEGEHDGNNGHADKIKYDSDVEGIVTAISFAADGTSIVSMTVMGQIVIIDDMTMFDDRLTADNAIVVGSLVEISGVFQDDGSILAKHVEFKIHGDIEIKGLVANLMVNADTATFDLGNCSITVNADTEFQGMESAVDIIEGIEVEVHSSADTGLGMIDMSNGCSVIASKIELEDAREEDRQFEFQKGEVTSELLEGRFSLTVKHDNGMTTDVVVIVNELTVYGEGSAADIVMGAMLHVHGMLDADDNLVANEIEIKSMMEVPHTAMASFDGFVDEIDLMAGTVTVLGQTIMVTEMTMIDGHLAVVTETPKHEPVVLLAAASEMLMPVSMTLADISVGDFAVIKVEKNAAGVLVALKLIFEQGVLMETSKVSGRVSAVDAMADTIFIEGVAVPGVAMLLPELVLDDSLLGQEALARGSFADGVLTANELAVHVPEVIVVEPMPVMDPIL